MNIPAHIKQMLINEGEVFAKPIPEDIEDMLQAIKGGNVMQPFTKYLAGQVEDRIQDEIDRGYLQDMLGYDKTDEVWPYHTEEVEEHGIRWTFTTKDGTVVTLSIAERV